MKKVLFPLLFFLLGSWCFAGDNYVKDLKKEGVQIVEKQCYDVSFEKWGKVRFVSGVKTDWPNKLRLFLSDAKGKIIYQFPEFSGNIWVFNKVRTVAFKDVNRDKLTDIIIIADNITGIDKEGTVPFPVCGVYFQVGKEFKTLPDFDQEINEAGQNETVDQVYKYIQKNLGRVNGDLKKK